MSDCNPKQSYIGSQFSAIVPQCEDKATPFIHKFRTIRHKYIYDVNTGRIVQVDAVTWDIIDDFGSLSKSQIISKYGPRYKSDEISIAHNDIKHVRQQEGLLLSTRPKQIMMPHTEDCIRQMLASNREQLILNVSEACNFRCAYCVFGEADPTRRSHTGRMMNWDTAKAAIDEFLLNSKKADHRAVTFYGGEPLLNLELLRRCVAYIRQDPQNEDVYFGLTTNGSLLTNEVGKFLASANVGITVSLDGPQHVHDKYRRGQGGNGTWHMVVNGVRRFLDNHPEYKTNGRMRFAAVSVPGTDVLEVDDFFRMSDLFSKGMGTSAMSVDPSCTTFLESLPSEDRRLHGIEELYQNFICNLVNGKIGDNLTDRAFVLQRAYFEQAFLRLHKRPYATQDHPIITDRMCVSSACIPGIRRTFVTVDGDYLVCERVPESDYMIIGNVREGVDVSKVREMYKEWVECNADECRLCWCLTICQAGCFSNVHENGVVTQNAKRKACTISRESIHRSLINYCSVLEHNPKAFDYMADITVA